MNGGRPPLAWRLRDGALQLWDWFFPPVCFACHIPLRPAAGDFLCRRCRSEIRVVADWPCPCAGGVPTEEERKLCELCRRLPSGFGTVRAAFPYGGVVGDMVRNLKYRHREHVAGALGRLVVAHLGEHMSRLKSEFRCEAIVPVPLHMTRAWGRGYNQSELIAVEVGRLLEVACEADIVIRCRRTPPQARRATPEQRLANTREAFRVPDPERVRGRHFILVDDVMTTGATMACCAEAMTAAGAGSVHLLSVCLAGSHHRIGPAPPEMSGVEDQAPGISVR